MSVAAAETGAQATSGLDWAIRLLFGAVGSSVRSRGEQPPRGFRPVESYLAVPSTDNPRLLVPLGSRRAAAAALARNHDATSPRARLAKSVLAAGLRTGAAQRILPHRLVVSVPASMPAPERAGVLLSDELGRIFDRPDACMAVLLGPPRLNRKPVLAVLTPDGEVIGYTKAAWNDLTRRLVEDEAAALAHFAAAPPTSFSAPRLVHHGPWGDLTLLATTALPNTARPSPDALSDPPVAVMSEIAGPAREADGPLAASGYWAEVRRRLDARSPGSGPDRLRGVVDHVEGRYGEVGMRYGRWHGDLTPWNMARLGEGTYVWDWERSAPGPRGLDLCHWLFQSVCRFGGRKPTESVEICRERTPGLLELLDVPAGSEDALWSVYRMELLFRYDEARLAGVLARPSRIHAGVLEMFEREMEAS
ncbi:MAG: hypothetical protein ACRDY7_09175 [Acidimicrobiia bacterium]